MDTTNTDDASATTWTEEMATTTEGVTTSATSSMGSSSSSWSSSSSSPQSSISHTSSLSRDGNPVEGRKQKKKGQEPRPQNTMGWMNNRVTPEKNRTTKEPLEAGLEEEDVNQLEKEDNPTEKKVKISLIVLLLSATLAILDNITDIIFTIQWANVQKCIDPDRDVIASGWALPVYVTILGTLCSVVYFIVIYRGWKSYGRLVGYKLQQSKSQWGRMRLYVVAQGVLEDFPQFILVAIMMNQTTPHNWTAFSALKLVISWLSLASGFGATFLAGFLMVVTCSCEKNHRYLDLKNQIKFTVAACIFLLPVLTWYSPTWDASHPRNRDSHPECAPSF